MSSADINKIPAGSALAVDRLKFSRFIDKKIKNDKNISFINKEVKSLKQFKDNLIVIATGPLTSKSLAHYLEKKVGKETLDFFDAIAPIIYSDSIDMSICWKQIRTRTNILAFIGKYRSLINRQWSLAMGIIPIDIKISAILNVNQ